MGNSSSSTLPALQVAASCDTAKFMGKWFVIASKPTYFETTASNAVETYTLLEGKGHDIQIDFDYNKDKPIESPLKSLPQKGWIKGDKKNSSTWKVSPMWPIKLPYLILEVDESDYCLIGYPSRAYCWIMSRKPHMSDSTYNMLTKKLEEKHQYDLEGLRKVPQVWTKEEREKRGLNDFIPDSMLTEMN